MVSQSQVLNELVWENYFFDEKFCVTFQAVHYVLALLLPCTRCSTTWPHSVLRACSFQSVMLTISLVSTNS